MKRYLLQITRQSRGERPSETQIYLDSKAADEADFSSISQMSSEDNYFVLSAGAAGIAITLIKLLATMPYTPMKLNAGDGFRVIEYPYSEKWTLSQGLREGSKCQIFSSSENGVSEFNEFNDFGSAMIFVSGLNSSDGYTIIDEGVDTQVISSRPSLWITDNEFENSSILNQKTFFPNRTSEKDRI